MNKNFWKAALIRAIRTVAQAALAMIPAAATIQQVNWLTVLSTAALAGVVSILTSIATGLPEAEPKTQDVRTIYLDEEGREIDPNDLQVEPDGTITVLAYDDYYDDGSPKSKDGITFPESIDEECNGETCDLSKYLEESEKNGNN